MDIFQKNVFGDNHIHSVSPNFTRELTQDLRNKIICDLNNLDVSSVSIRFEYSSESEQFVNSISQFLKENDYNVCINKASMSEIKRNEFGIQQHPADPSFAIITIGTLL